MYCLMYWINSDAPLWADAPGLLPGFQRACDAGHWLNGEICVCFVFLPPAFFFSLHVTPAMDLMVSHVCFLFFVSPPFFSTCMWHRPLTLWWVKCVFFFETMMRHACFFLFWHNGALCVCFFLYIYTRTHHTTPHKHTHTCVCVFLWCVCMYIHVYIVLLFLLEYHAGKTYGTFFFPCLVDNSLI